MTNSIYSTSKFIGNCFKIVESYGSKTLSNVVNEATYACATITDEEVAKAACYVRGIQTDNVDRQEAFTFFKELIERVNYNTEELSSSTRKARNGF